MTRERRSPAVVNERNRAREFFDQRNGVFGIARFGMGLATLSTPPATTYNIHLVGIYGTQSQRCLYEPRPLRHTEAPVWFPAFRQRFHFLRS